MLRGLVIKSTKLSLIEKGMTYIMLFVIASYFYLYLFNKQVVLMCMIFLSLIALMASILSDSKTLKQFISTLILCGAKRQTIEICIWVYLAIRVTPVLFMYILYSTHLSYAYVLALALPPHVVSMFLLTYMIYRVMRL